MIMRCSYEQYVVCQNVVDVNYYIVLLLASNVHVYAIRDSSALVSLLSHVQFHSHLAYSATTVLRYNQSADSNCACCFRHLTRRQHKRGPNVACRWHTTKLTKQSPHWHCVAQNRTSEAVYAHHS